MAKVILLIDDGAGGLAQIGSNLASWGYQPQSLGLDQSLVLAELDVEPQLLIVSSARADAISLVQGIRGDPVGAILPVFFVGASSGTVATPAEALNLGADYFFSAPLDWSDLKGRITTYIGPGEEPATPSGTESLPTSSPETDPSPVISPRGLPQPLQLEPPLQEAEAASPGTEKSLPEFEWSASDVAPGGDMEEAAAHLLDLIQRESMERQESAASNPVPDNLMPIGHSHAGDSNTPSAPKESESDWGEAQVVKEVLRGDSEAVVRSEPDDPSAFAPYTLDQNATESLLKALPDHLPPEVAPSAAVEKPNLSSEEPARATNTNEDTNPNGNAEGSVEEQILKVAQQRAELAEEQARLATAREQALIEEAQRERLAAETRRLEEAKERTRLEVREWAREAVEALAQSEVEKERLRQREKEEESRRVAEEARLLEEHRRREMAKAAHQEATERVRREAEEQKERELAESNRLAAERMEAMEERLRKELEEKLRHEILEELHRGGLLPTPNEAQPAEEENDEEPDLRRTPRSPSIQSGTLSMNFDIAKLFQTMWTEQVTGRVDINREGARKSVFFEEGKPVAVESNLPADAMEEYLLRSGKLSGAHYNLIRGRRFQSARQIGSFLVTEGYLKPEELFEVVRGHFEEVILGLFEWVSGQYRYVAEVASDGHRVVTELESPALILRGIRLKYLMPRLLEKVGSPSSLLAPRGESRAEDDLLRMDLSSEEKQLVRLVDGTRSVDDLVFSAGLQHHRVYAVLAALLSIGWAKVMVSGLETPQGAFSGVNDEIDGQRIRDKVKHIRQADYFEILGLGRESTPVEVEQACQRLLNDFARERFSPKVRRDYEKELNEIERVIEDAGSILVDQQLRSAYSRHAT